MKRACIMGWPVSHSRSPLIHTTWLNHFGLEGAYVKQPVSPDEAHDFFRALKQKGYVGGNVTVPHKEVAFAAVDQRDKAAEAIGAVNTLWYEGERLIGGNTDAYGYIANLNADVPHWQSHTETALVLGAGGAALAVTYGLLQEGVARILIANRSFERAVQIAERFGPNVVALHWPEIDTHLPQTDLLVHTTSLGMSGKDPLILPLDKLKPSAYVSDIVYVPLKTQLLKAAAARGHRISTGLGMLLHQAVPGFERWFGQKPSVTPELFDLIIKDIEAGT